MTYHQTNDLNKQNHIFMIYIFINITPPPKKKGDKNSVDSNNRRL